MGILHNADAADNGVYYCIKYNGYMFVIGPSHCNFLIDQRSEFGGVHKDYNVTKLSSLFITGYTQGPQSEQIYSAL